MPHAIVDCVPEFVLRDGNDLDQGAIRMCALANIDKWSHIAEIMLPAPS